MRKFVQHSKWIMNILSDENESCTSLKTYLLTIFIKRDICQKHITNKNRILTNYINTIFIKIFILISCSYINSIQLLYFYKNKFNFFEINFYIHKIKLIKFAGHTSELKCLFNMAVCISINFNPWFHFIFTYFI